MIKKPLQTVFARLTASFARQKLNEQIFNVLQYWSWMDQSLENLRSLGFSPTTILDVGAASGEFYRKSRRIFPEAWILLFEGRRSQLDTLQAQTSQDPRSEVFIEVLGAQDSQEVTFHRQGVGSSVYRNLRKAYNADPQTRHTVTLDKCVAQGEHILGDRVLLKADVQGFEIEVLQGATATLERTEVLLLECSLLELNEGCPLLADVINHVGALGFSPYDICTFFRHGPNKRLRQIDMLFLRSDSPINSLR